MSSRSNKDEFKQILDFGYRKGNVEREISVQQLIKELSHKLSSIVKEAKNGKE
ncbi:MAG: hypothetical protein ACO1OT_15265 [Heyndrickxia sp.]